jgi:hypothetical protein
MATTVIQRSTVPEVIFPKSLNESDTIFAQRPTNSSIQRKRDIIISKNFTGIIIAIYNAFFLSHLSIVRYHFPVTGK